MRRARAPRPGTAGRSVPTASVPPASPPLDRAAQRTEPVGELAADLLRRIGGQPDAEQVDVRLPDPRSAGGDGAVQVELDTAVDRANLRDRRMDDRLESGRHPISPRGLSIATYTSPSGTLNPSVKILKWWINASIDSSMRARGGGVTFLSWMR